MREIAISDDKKVQFESPLAAAELHNLGDPTLDEEGGCKPTKRRRTWELWSVSAKRAFFEALNECGKDFDKIQAHFQNTLKNKKNLPADYAKNKDQIRHYYYRTWHKISAFVKFESDLNKSTRELFGLINYGEIWKKVGGTLDDRMGVKLNELVQRGSTTVKHKGKTFRVKTPVCRALKNLHNKGGDKSGLQKGKKCMPTKVTIDLKPLDTKDWCRTHKLAQNPHIKVSLGLQRKVSSLINCLSNKWKSRETKAFELLQAKDENPRAEELQEELVLFPSQSAKPNFTLITVAHVLTSSQISLQSMKPDKPQQAKVKVKLKLSERETLVRDTNGNREGGAGPSSSQDCDKSFDQGQMSQDEGGEDYILEDSEGESSRSPVPPPDKEWDMEADNDNDDDEEDNDDKDIEEQFDAKETKLVEAKTNFSNLKEFNPSVGWSLGTSGATTVGELFYMLAEEGSSHFELEYTWRTIKPENNDTEDAADTKEEIKPACQNILFKLVKLSNDKSSKAGRGRSNSLSSTSPSTQTGKPGRGKQNSVLSPAVRNILSPTSPVTSRTSPAVSRGIVKQLSLASDLPEKPGSPLAVPLEPVEVVEFRKPLAPAPPALSSTLQAQLGHYFPKFTNRRGRQNRRNQLVGRQILQPIQPKQPPPTFQSLVLPALSSLAPAPSTNTNPIVINAPLILSANGIIQSSTVLHPSTNTRILPVSRKELSSTSLLSAPVSPIHHHPRSPPQICIPSPALSPARECPSPTPSFSALMDISFNESAPATPTKADNFMAMMDDSSLLHTPPRRSSPAPTSPSRCLADSADISLNSWALNFESPSKQSSVSVMQHNEDSQASVISTDSEVDRQLTAMMNENSMDFTSTFRALAKHVASSDQELSQS